MPKKTLPFSEVSWDRMAERLGINQDTSIHTSEQHSGSKIEEYQFCLLRAFWIDTEGDPLRFLKDAIAANWIGQQEADKAKTFLKRLPAWEAYIKSMDPGGSRVTNTGNVPNDCGTFSLVRYYQHLSVATRDNVEEAAVPKVELSPRKLRSRTRALQMTDRPSTPSPMPSGNAAPSEVEDELERLSLSSDSSSEAASNTSMLSRRSPISGEAAKQYHPIEDEQIVNTALVLFLNALTIHYPNMEGQWTMYRHAFVLSDPDNNKVFEARTDGVFRLAGNAEPRIIIEVKPYVRRTSEKVFEKIRMQEAAQMAAWISTTPRTDRKPSSKVGTQHRRLLISQDRQEIYITVATYDDDYVAYIRDGDTRGGSMSFLHLQEFGPFMADTARHMNALGIIMLAFSIQGGVKG